MQSLLLPLISCNVRLSLSHPKFNVGRRRPSTTTGVCMPEATMDKDYRAMLRKHYIWLAWQVGPMKPKAKSKGV